MLVLEAERAIGTITSSRNSEVFQSCVVTLGGGLQSALRSGGSRRLVLPAGEQQSSDVCRRQERSSGKTGGWAVDWARAPSAKVASWTCYPPMQESDVRLLRGARPADQAMWQTDRRNLVRRGSRARVIHELRLIARAPSRSERQVPILESIRQQARVRLWPCPAAASHRGTCKLFLPPRRL